MKTFCLKLGFVSLIYFCFPSDIALAQDRSSEQAPTIEDYAIYFASELPSAEDKNSDSAEAASVEREKMILSISSILAKGAPENETTQLRRKLAVLYLEQHNYFRHQEMAKYQEAFKQWNDSGRKTDEPQISRDLSNITNAANMFREIINNAPRHLVKEDDMASLVLSLARIGNESTPNYLKMMLERFPDSKYIIYVRMALAEFYFDQRSLAKALDLYKEFGDKKDSPLCAYAYYKIGWAHFLQREQEKEKSAVHAQKAIVAMKLTAKLVEKEKKYQGSFDLKEETFKDLSCFWAMFRDVTAAKQFFEQEKRRDYFFATLEKLAQIYGEEKNYQKAASIMEQLIGEDQENLENPRRYLSLLQYREASGLDPNHIAMDLKKMKTLFFGQTVWTKANSDKEGKIKETEDLLEKALSGYGSAYHQEGLGGKRNYTEAAVKIYQLYLETFPKAEKSYDVRYFLGDLLTQLKRLEDASEQYYLVTQAAPKDGKFLKDAAYNAVACLNELINNQQFSTLPHPYTLNKPLALPEIKAKFIKMMDNYVSLLPNEENAVSMRYFAAEIFFQYGHFSEAIPRYHEVIFKSASSEQAPAAVLQVFEYYKNKVMFREGVDLAKEIVGANLPLGKEPMIYVTGMYKYSVSMLAFSLAEQKKFQEAGDWFVFYQTTFTDAKDADQALAQAFDSYFQAGALAKGILAAETLLRDYGSSKFRVEADYFVAVANERIANFVVAAQKYQEFATNYSDDQRAPEALKKAAHLNIITSKDENAVQILSLILQKYPDSADAETYFTLGKELEKLNKFAEARSVYDKAQRSLSRTEMDQIFFAQAKEAETYLFEGNKIQARKTARSLAQKLSENKEKALGARKKVASILFGLVDGEKSDFLSSFPKQDGKIKDLGRVKKQLEALAAEYEFVARLGATEQALASLFQNGEMYDVVAGKLSPDKLALPFQSEAEKYFLLGYNLAKKSKAVNPWTGKIYDRLSRLHPEKYRAVDDMTQEASYQNHSFSVNERVSALTEGH